MNTQSFLFHGLKLAISGEDTILAALKCRLGQFPAAEPGTPSHLRFEFHPVPDPRHHGVDRPSGPNRKVLDLWGGEVLYFDASQQLYIDSPGRARALCDTTTGSVWVSYLESEVGDDGLLSHPFFTIPLAELLKRHGLFMVHAAGLSLDGKGLLIAGASGAGKTTLTIALLRAGFGFLGDDITFLCTRSDGLRARAFPDELDVTADTLSFFPKLPGLAREAAAADRPKRPFSPHSSLRWQPSLGMPARSAYFPTGRPGPRERVDAPA